MDYDGVDMVDIALVPLLLSPPSLFRFLFLLRSSAFQVHPLC